MKRWYMLKYVKDGDFVLIDEFAYNPPEAMRQAEAWLVENNYGSGWKLSLIRVGDGAEGA